MQWLTGKRLDERRDGDNVQKPATPGCSCRVVRVIRVRTDHACTLSLLYLGRISNLSFVPEAWRGKSNVCVLLPIAPTTDQTSPAVIYFCGGKLTSELVKGINDARARLVCNHCCIFFEVLPYQVYILNASNQIVGPRCRGCQALEDAEEVRRQALAKAAHQREQDLADERERRDKLARADARNREEERGRKAEEHRLQVYTCITHAPTLRSPFLSLIH